MMNSIKNRVETLVRQTIADYDMLSEREAVLVGFSGGSDSVCLLSVLYSMGYNVTAAHLNHNMRDNAFKDEEFCRRFCAERGIPFVSETAEKGILKNEADAREARYRFFAEVMKKYGIERLATAHNKNDCAETVLLHLLRGATTDGLCGISPSDGKVVRPLIRVKKCEINRYCAENGLEYVIDETNLECKYTRNKLRNIYIPELEREFNPRLTDTVADNAALMLCDREYLAKCAVTEYEKIKVGTGVDAKKLAELDRAISSRIAELMWQETGGAQKLPGKYIGAVLSLAENKSGGKRIDLPDKTVARVEYGVLYIEKKAEYESFDMQIVPERWYDFPGISSRGGLFVNGKGLTVSLNGDEILSVRTRKNGDRFYPSGLGGSKTLSDFFTDIKLPASEREQMPVLIADGLIAAVGDIRCGDAFSKGKRAVDYAFVIEKI